MARAQGIDVRVVGASRGRGPGFDLDPETFAETRTAPKEEAWVEYLRLEYHAQAKPQPKPQAQQRFTSSDPSLDKNIERLKRTVEHPNTPEHERAAAAQQLAKLITKKSKKDGRT